ncbi:SAND domain-containing protein [Trichostrongylus colubriformis]|uniref:SAND domain-containing protein n=1 Tax=Trichostrongylus colubriformis TaxID=6319 RepID=A0AAN8ILU7_TRICO
MSLSRESVSISPPDTVTDDENGAVENMGDVGKIIEVKCGSLAAKMHVEKFLCPGIHQPCIEFEKEMITPKEFTVRANKDKQKDWKGSIRIGKSNLRSLMEMHSFDFFNHSHFCSAKCQSRNYITPKTKDSDKGRRRSSTSQAETNTIHISELLNSRLFASNACRLDAGTISQLVGLNTALNGKSNSNVTTVTPASTTTPTTNNNNNNNNNNTLSLFSISSLNSTAQDSTEEYVDVDGTTDVKQEPPTPTTEQILRLMMTEPISFWNEMNKFGLLDPLVDQLLECLSNVKCAAKTGGLAWAAPALTSVASVLHMGDQLVNSIHSKPFGELQSNKPLLSMESVYNGSRKRSLDESSQSSQSRCSPDVKRPRVQYPTNMMTALDMDPRVLQALAQAQLRLSHETERMFMQSVAPLTIPGTLPAPTFD